VEAEAGSQREGADAVERRPLFHAGDEGAEIAGKHDYGAVEWFESAVEQGLRGEGIDVDRRKCGVLGAEARDTNDRDNE